MDEQSYNVIYLCLMRCSTCVLDWCGDLAESSSDCMVQHNDFLALSSYLNMIAKFVHAGCSSGPGVQLDCRHLQNLKADDV